MKRPSGYVTTDLLNENFIPFDCNMIRRRCFEELGGLDETLPQSDDYELLLRFSTRFRFFFHPKIVARCRVMHNQISTNKEGRFRAIHTILSRFFSYHPTIVPDNIKRLTWCRFYVRRGRYWASSGFHLHAVRDYLIAMRYAPLHLGPWRALLRLLLLWR